MSSRNRGDSLRHPASPTSTPNAFMGVAIQVARKTLFIETRKKALFLFCAITLLSLAATFISFDDSYYVVQKHSIFNQYGVKLGWFWTCVVVGPFIWFCSKAHYRDKDRWIIDILRLAVATFFWYTMTTGFHRLLVATSRCDVNVKLSRAQCSLEKGTWIPGLDISGHCFLMLYSILIISEEAFAFRNWNVLSDSGPNEKREQFESTTRIVRYFFVAMLALTLFWMKQLVISTLYYHIWYDKVIGALVAVLCWGVTYKVLYPLGFLQPPINRAKSQQRSK